MKRTILSVAFLLYANLLCSATFNRYGMVLVPDGNGGYKVANYDNIIAKVPCIRYAPDLLVPWKYIPEKLQPEEYTRFSTVEVVYKDVDGRRLDMKIDLPAEGGNFPVLIFIHGGGYHSGSNNQFDKQSKYFASKGIAVARPAYSLDGQTEGVNIDITIGDLRDAVVFLKKHGVEWGIDASRIAFSGISAGGHLCSYIAMTTPGTRCCMPMAGFQDFTLIERFKKRKYMNPYNPDDLALLSPVHLANGSSPAYMLIHGTGDHVLELEHSVIMHRRLQELGVESHLLLYPYLVHNIPMAENCYYEDYMLNMLTFMQKHLYP